ncbi:MAG: MMPL family transporter [Deltaproteobacteria bacterium]|nr:MMPL family transporter [Deltaproteobacteria bacterium]
MQRYFEMVSRKALLFLIVIFGITVFFASHLTRLHVDTSVTRMLVQDLPAKQQYDRYRKEFGGAEDNVLVVFKAEDVFSADSFQKIGELTEALKGVVGVSRVVSLSTLMDDLDVLNEWTLEDLRRNLGMADIFSKNLISVDGRVTALVAMLKQDHEIGPTTVAVEKVLERFRGPGYPLKLYQIGYPVIGHTLTEYTEKDFKTLPFFTMSIIFLVLLFCFRNLRGALVPFTAVCITLVWTFGLMGLLDRSLCMVTMIIPTLLIAVGSAYAMHIMAAYFDETTRQETNNQAVVKGLTRVCLPTIFASITTIVCFASLSLNQIAVVKEFAFFSCVGLFFMLIIHLTFIPSALSYPRTLKFEAVRGPENAAWIALFLRRVVQAVRNYPRTILLVALVVSVICVAGLWQIRVETTPISFFKDPSKTRMAFEDIHENLAGIYPINVILRSDQEGYFASPRALREVEALQEHLATIEGVDLSISIVDLLKFEGLLTRGFREKEKYYTVPDYPFAVREAIKNYRLFDADELVDHFVSRDFSRINIVCRSHIASTGDFIRAEEVMTWYLRDWCPDGITFDVTGLPIVGSHSARALTKGQIWSLGLALVCIFLLLSALFLSPKVGLLAMIPNLFPILVNFGIMGWAGLHLTVATSLVASIAIGLAVDDTIHYMFRFNYQFRRDFRRRQANYRTIADVGKPIVFTSIAIGLGFSVLLFSSFVPTSVFGLLILITMASALFGDLFILPVIMQATPWLLVILERGIGSYGSIPAFKNLSLAEARRVILAGFRYHCTRGDVIFREGDPGRGMYLLLQGEVRLSSSAGGSDNVITDLGQGGVFGKLGIAGSPSRVCTATARDSCVMIHINEQTMDYLENRFPKIAFTLFLNLMAIVDAQKEKASVSSKK